MINKKQIVYILSLVGLICIVFFQRCNDGNVSNYNTNVEQDVKICTAYVPIEKITVKKVQLTDTIEKAYVDSVLSKTVADSIVKQYISNYELIKYSFTNKFEKTDEFQGADITCDCGFTLANIDGTMQVTPISRYNRIVLEPYSTVKQNSYSRWKKFGWVVLGASLTYTGVKIYENNK